MLWYVGNAASVAKQQVDQEGALSQDAPLTQCRWCETDGL